MIGWNFFFIWIKRSQNIQLKLKERGGIIFPGGRYEALESNKIKVDSYGCGDSFAAGILYGMASKWNIDKSLNLAKVLGRDASEFFGPYKNDKKE